MAIFSERTAILVDGGFYRLQAKKLFGKKDPEERADELFSYCMRHLNKGSKEEIGRASCRERVSSPV